MHASLASGVRSHNCCKFCQYCEYCEYCQSSYTIMKTKLLFNFQEIVLRTLFSLISSHSCLSSQVASGRHRRSCSCRDVVHFCGTWIAPSNRHNSCVIKIKLNRILMVYDDTIVVRC